MKKTLPIVIVLISLSCFYGFRYKTPNVQIVVDPETHAWIETKKAELRENDVKRYTPYTFYFMKESANVK